VRSCTKVKLVIIARPRSSEEEEAAKKVITAETNSIGKRIFYLQLRHSDACSFYVSARAAAATDNNSQLILSH
jgi:hypothetical protein